MKENKKNKDTEVKMDPYAIDKLHKVPFWLKVIVLKWWFFGAIYFFMLMGIFVESVNDGSFQWLAIGAGLVAGAFYDLVINKIIMLWETDKHEGQYYSMIISKKYYAMLVNIVYFVFLFIIIYIVQNLLGYLTNDIMKLGFSIGGDPITFGLLAVVIDGIFLLIKFGIRQLINKIKNNKTVDPQE